MSKSKDDKVEMQNLPEKTESKVPTQNDTNIFTAYGEGAGGVSYIIGELLKFSKGDYLLGKDTREVPDGTKVVADMDKTIVGWQHWWEQRPTCYRMGLLVEGFVPPPREELGETDRDLWERDALTDSPRDLIGPH